MKSEGDFVIPLVPTVTLWSIRSLIRLTPSRSLSLAMATTEAAEATNVEEGELDHVEAASSASLLKSTNAAPPDAKANASSQPAALAEDELMRMMQLPTRFDTTAGKAVDDPRAKLEGVAKKRTRRYRQYMNRKGGFNRPLDAI